LRLIFIGASKFGLKCLQRALKVPDLRVVGVVTADQTFTISYAPSGVTNVLHADLASLAASHGIPVLRLRDSMSDRELLSSVEALLPDAFLVVGWYHMIPRRWREVAPAFGLHASLLPDYSGGAPLVWAMINGESKTGVTLFQMDDGVDSGPIAAQAEEPIRSDDTIATLYARIEERGLELLDRTLPLLIAATLHLEPQPCSGRRVMPQRSPEDGRIDWTRDASFIDRWIRAQTRPYPGAFTEFEGQRLIVWSAAIDTEICAKADPGAVVKGTDGRYVVACSNGFIQLCEVSHGTQTFTAGTLATLLRGGGQRLGGLASCMRNSGHC